MLLKLHKYLILKVQQFQKLTNLAQQMLLQNIILIMDKETRYMTMHRSVLKPKYQPPEGPLVVFFNRFKSSGPGFFTVDSYTANTVTNYDYGLIPVYASPTLTGSTSSYQLRDVIDFRPVRSDATASSGSSVTFDVNPSTTGPKVPKIAEDIILDYSYYLPKN